MPEQLGAYVIVCASVSISVCVCVQSTAMHKPHSTQIASSPGEVDRIKTTATPAFHFLSSASKFCLTVL